VSVHHECLAGGQSTPCCPRRVTSSIHEWDTVLERSTIIFGGTRISLQVYTRSPENVTVGVQHECPASDQFQWRHKQLMSLDKVQRRCQDAKALWVNMLNKLFNGW